MRATGSNDCMIEDVFVSDDCVFSWFDAAAPLRDRDVRADPVAHAVRPRLAATAVGAARGAQQRFIELATAKRPVGAMHDARRAVLRADGRRRGRGLILAAEDTLAAAAAETWRRGEAVSRSTGRHACRVPHAPRDRGAARRPRDRPSPRRGGHERDRRAVAARARVARRPRRLSTHPSRRRAHRGRRSRTPRARPRFRHLTDLPSAGSAVACRSLLVVLLGACAVPTHRSLMSPPAVARASQRR